MDHWLTLLNMACWAICFFWMYRISSRQDAVLKALHRQTKRIGKLSKKEHDLIKEVHPVVGEISAELKEVSEKVEDLPRNRR